jgi:filamentous hemagglutinin family protein
MKTKLYLSFLALTALPLSVSSVQAQTYQPSNRTPVSDNTLGTQVSGNGGNFNITGGVRKGQTLFHSFNDFSVPTNGSANFLNSFSNRDIITRVTGNLFSDINGTVNTNGANFFLINPNGIVFGTNARLNVGKAFVGSTANSLDLVDGGGRTITFGTNPNGDAPLLAVNPNVLFNVSRLNLGGGTGAISNFGTLQTPNDSQYIGLIGGNITLNGGKIIAPGGQIELGGLSVAGSVGLSTDGNNLKAQFPTNIARGDVSLANQSRINVIGTGKGDVTITARNIDLLGGSVIASGIGQGLGTPETVAGDIKLNATGKIAIVGSSSGILNTVSSNATGQGGNITLDTSSLFLQDGAQLQALTLGRGNVGNVTVNAKDTVSLTNNSAIANRVQEGGIGKGGNININGSGASLTLVDGAQLLSNTRGASASQSGGQGDAGNINVKVRAINISGKSGSFPSGIRSDIGRGAIGKGGNITIEADSFDLKGGAEISAATLGQGNAGNITIKAKDNITLDRANILSSVEAGGVGDGGDIEISGASFSQSNGAQILSSTRSAFDNQPAGQGNAGNVKLKVNGAVRIIGTNGSFPTSIATFVDPGTVGNGGNISIETGSFSLQDGAQLLASTEGQGNAGTITVNAADFFTIAGRSGLVTNSRGQTGFLTSSLLVTSLSQTGKAGDIIVASPQISVDGGAIKATSLFGNGGNIQIGGQSGSTQGSKIPAVDLLLLRRKGQISTSAGGTPQSGGNGGNIKIDSKLIVAIPTENSDISANAVKGRGGNVTINSQGLFGIQFRPQSTVNSDITASSDFGLSGSVQINTPGVDPGKDSTELPKVTTDASNQISQVCSATNRQNKLTVAGRGGLPPTANDPLTSDVIWQDARAASRQPAVSSAMTNPVELAPPAVGWIFNGKKVTLIAAKTNGQLTGTSVACPNIK